MSKTGVQLWREGGRDWGLVGGIFMRGNKSNFLRHSALRSLSEVWYLKCISAFTCYLQNGSASAFFHLFNTILGL